MISFVIYIFFVGLSLPVTVIAIREIISFFKEVFNG